MSWPRRKIGEVAKVKGGKRLPKGMSVVDYQTEHPYLRVVDFDEGGIDRSDIKYIDPEAFARVKRYTITSNDIYISIAGTIGRVGTVPVDLSGANLTENAAKVCDISTSVDHRYLMYYLRSPEGQGSIHNRTGGTSQPKLALFRIADIDFPYLPLQAQSRIADILSAYDELIENNRRRIQLLEEAARLLYREWFVHLRFPGHEHVAVVDGVPEGWERKKIADVCETVGGGTPSTNVAEYWDGDITWVVPTDVTRNDSLVLLDSERKITEKGLRESSAKMVPPEAILMTSRASVGFFALMDQPVCTNQGFISIIPHDRNLRMYLLFNLMSRVDEIRGNAKGSTYPEISKGRFREMCVIIPSETLVNEFSGIGKDIVDQVRCLKRTMLQLAIARDLLLPRLLNGEISV